MPKKPSDIRERIHIACEKLLASGKPIIRQEIARLAGCQLRTVSMHREVWEPYLVKSQIQSPPSDRFSETIRQRLHNIEEKAESLSTSALKSTFASLNWFALIVEEPEDKELLKRVERKLQVTYRNKKEEE